MSLNEPKLRLIYAGTPEFSVPGLRALKDAGHEIACVLTQPDRPAGRGQRLRASPVKQAAQELGLEVLQPLSLRKADIKRTLRQLNADAMIVAAYGLILPQSVLAMPRLGCLNIHASLLPRWRGAAPIQRAIEAGDAETGITIMQMDAGLDTGDILSLYPTKIENNDTAQTLHDRLSIIGAMAIVETLHALANAELQPQVQEDAKATYAHKLHKSEAEIDWCLSAQEIENKVRAFNPWPCAFTGLAEKNLRIWNARAIEQIDAPQTPGKILYADKRGLVVQTGNACLEVLELQLAGKKRINVDQFVNARNVAGLILS